MTPLRRIRHRAAEFALAMAVLSAASLPAFPAFADEAPDPALHDEWPDDPPGVPARTASPAGTATTITFGRFTSIQVNVNAAQQNIVGDAANEPTIAVDPADPLRMVIGWRQFDTIASNFRQAGVGLSTDGGLTWTRSTIEPGVFRSDPVLTVDAAGRFFYNSLSTPGGFLATHVFPSTTGGASWGTPVHSYGGDKQWMTTDRTASPGADRHYQAWSTASNPHAPNTFNLSPGGAGTWSVPSVIPNSPVWGTLDVASDGTLYVAGMSGSGGPLVVARSTNAATVAFAPTFTVALSSLGGTLRTGGPNPVGLLGQLWVAVDRSGGPRHGWVYLLGSVQTATDPLDVMFIRSTDGGQTWSAPVRINDDPAGNRAWQWFGTLSVSSDGRIDVAWNDTRGSSDSTWAALYYASSFDGGFTWTPNEQASPVWRSTAGWPNQQKIGDYYHMVSDATGADLAYAATFHNEQDVYYLRIAKVTTGVEGLADRGPRLHPAHPNPFTAATMLRFDLPASGARIRLDVFDTRGRRVARLVDGFRPGGAQAASWNGRDERGRPVPAGVYFCRLEGAGSSEVRRLLRIH